MKKIILFLAVITLGGVANAQSEKYTAAMNANISLLDSIRTKNNGLDVANNFARIGDAEKNQWLPNYYAAYSAISQAYAQQDLSQKDALADKANEYLTKAEAIIGKENSETEVIRSMIATTHMLVDPQSRYMEYGPQVGMHIEKAKILDPSNPRPWLLEAENKFYTPAAFGGGKDVAKESFDKAASLFEKFSPTTTMSPVWGKDALNYFLAQYK